MKNENVQIKIRIFLNRTSWHFFLSNFIKSHLIEDMSNNNNFIKNWFINFSKDRGDHILLTIIKNADSNILEKNLSKALELFISKYPSKTDPINLPINTFFINYPNNSYWFEKESTITSVKYTNDEIELKQVISKVITFSLGNEIINDDDLFTLMIYLQTSVLKAVKSDINEAYIFFEQFINRSKKTIYNSYKDNLEIEKERRFFQYFFKNNFQTLSEIVDDIWLRDNFNEDFEWLGDWVYYCNRFIKKNNNINLSFTIINSIIFDHLDFTNKGRDTINKLILKALVMRFVYLFILVKDILV
ncbi:hypothetical protein [Pedobacter glucosidilyticus]|uniref:hypothetical protein n=1 Tax=Pedobacter glucosidilyticus TaxID=1122941 RepID=UPI0026ECD721|nr:hypothetical protein [Pedobacter glucosidilyticus]